MDKIRINFRALIDHPYDVSDLTFYHTLYFSKSPTPQVYPDSNVFNCCRLKSHLWTARHTMRKTPVGVNGKPYWTINYDLVVAAKASLEFSIEIDGKDYGSVEASYE